MSNPQQLSPSEAIGVDLDAFAEQVMSIVQEGLVKACDSPERSDQLHAQTLEAVSGSAFGLCVLAREHALVGALSSIAASRADPVAEEPEDDTAPQRTSSGGIVDNPDGTITFRPN